MRSLLRRVPRAAWLCAVVAVLNAMAWSLVTPPFQVPDEPQHLAYAQYLAETGRLPGTRPGLNDFSSEEYVAFYGTYVENVVGNPQGRPPWSAASSERVKRRLKRDNARDDGGGTTTAITNPPLYYALQSGPYLAARSATLLDRLVVMRLLSALLAGVTVLFCFAFAREVLTGMPWTWTVAALAVAFQPVFGFIGGGVTPDNLLFAASAATLFLTARAFRRGLSVRLGLALGAVVGLGLLAKGTMIGLVPGVVVGLGLLVLRAGTSHRGEALRAAVLAVGLAGGLGLGYLAVANTVWDRALYEGTGPISTSVAGKALNLGELISYAWQFYFPRLPFMTDQWTGYPAYSIWFESFIGRFGWLDYGFPRWVYPVAGAVCVTIGVLVAASLVSAHAAVRERWAEFVTYMAFLVGLIALIAIAGYRYRIDTGYPFEQARYLFPLLALYGVVLALAARAGGPRYGPALGAAMVVLAIAHGLFAQLITVARYYA